MLPLYIEYPAWITPYVINGLPVRWYAVMYLVAFFIAYMLIRYQVRNDGVIQMSEDDTQTFFFSSIICLLIFARIFSVLFYSDGLFYLTHPWLIFWPFRNGEFVGLPGMSYHGGVVGAVFGGWLFARKNKRSLLQLADLACAGIPLGYTFGRIGNFINAELYGRVTDKPWGMIFPGAERFSPSLEWVQEIAAEAGLQFTSGAFVNLPRHPSQLYEAFFEGIVLFFILWFFVRPMKIRKGLPHGTVFCSYLMGYGIFRFFIEYCRQPDSNRGYIIAGGPGADNIALFGSFLNISEGQIFCFLMVAVGALILVLLLRRSKVESRRTVGKTSGKAKRKKT